MFFLLMKFPEMILRRLSNSVLMQEQLTVEVRGGVWGKHVTEIDDDDVKRAQDVLSKYSVPRLQVSVHLSENVQ